MLDELERVEPEALEEVEVVFDSRVDFRGKFVCGALCVGVAALLTEELGEFLPADFHGFIPPFLRVLANDHHGAIGVLGDPVGCRAEQVVTQEVAAVAEYDQVGAQLAGDADDQLGRVTGSQLNVELDA